MGITSKKIKSIFSNNKFNLVIDKKFMFYINRLYVFKKE